MKPRANHKSEVIDLSDFLNDMQPNEPRNENRQIHLTCNYLETDKRHRQPVDRINIANTQRGKRSKTEIKNTCPAGLLGEMKGVSINQIYEGIKYRPQEPQKQVSAYPSHYGIARHFRSRKHFVNQQPYRNQQKEPVHRQGNHTKAISKLTSKKVTEQHFAQVPCRTGCQHNQEYSSMQVQRPESKYDADQKQQR